jgi:hypothetical protein
MCGCAVGMDKQSMNFASEGFGFTLFEEILKYQVFKRVFYEKSLGNLGRCSVFCRGGCQFGREFRG